MLKSELMNRTRTKNVGCKCPFWTLPRLASSLPIGRLRTTPRRFGISSQRPDLALLQSKSINWATLDWYERNHRTKVTKPEEITCTFLPLFFTASCYGRRRSHVCQPKWCCVGTFISFTLRNITVRVWSCLGKAKSPSLTFFVCCRSFSPPN